MLVGVAAAKRGLLDTATLTVRTPLSSFQAPPHPVLEVSDD